MSWLLVCVFAGSKNYLFSSVNVLFAMGMGAAWLIRRDRVRRPATLAAFGLLAFAGCALLDMPSYLRSWGYGLGASLMLLGAVQVELTRKVSIPGFLELLGNASYSVYLVHLPLVSLLCKLLLPLPKEAAFPIIALLSVAGGFVFYVVFEKPLWRLLVRKSAPFAPRPVAAVRRGGSASRSELH
jgi:peptidoglycan/LPS O-acetylase OafA/YrhL